MEFISEDGKTLHQECSTLVLPALSIGNVGQLGVDLLISCTRAERIGYLDDPNVLPCVGNDAYFPCSIPQLALSLEGMSGYVDDPNVLPYPLPLSNIRNHIYKINALDNFGIFLAAYDSPTNSLTFIQQRSPVVKGRMLEYAKNIADFAAANGKKHVVLLSSLDFGRWQTIDMSSGLQIYYLSSANMDGTDDDCERLGWKRLQEYNPAQRRWKHLNDLAGGKAVEEDTLLFEDELQDEDYFPSLPFAAMFSCLKAKGLKVTCLLCYCSEGDNMADSFQLAEAASKIVGLRDSNIQGNEGGKWTIPFSWQSVYGPPPDMSLF